MRLRRRAAAIHGIIGGKYTPRAARCRWLSCIVSLHPSSFIEILRLSSVKYSLPLPEVRKPSSFPSLHVPVERNPPFLRPSVDAIHYHPAQYASLRMVRLISRPLPHYDYHYHRYHKTHTQTLRYIIYANVNTQRRDRSEDRSSGAGWRKETSLNFDVKPSPALAGDSDLTGTGG